MVQILLISAQERATVLQTVRALHTYLRSALSWLVVPAYVGKCDYVDGRQSEPSNVHVYGCSFH